MAEFTWQPTKSSTGDATSNVAKMKYGEGYEERAPYGINNVARKWSLEFHDEDGTVILAIDNFLTAKGGANFTWIQPFPFVEQGEKFWNCESWNWMYEGARLMGLRCEFNRAFLP